MDDKFIDSSSLAFYKQNLYEYEQGITVAVVKGRLRAHLLFWVELNNDPSCPDNKKNGRYLQTTCLFCTITSLLGKFRKSLHMAFEDGTSVENKSLFCDFTAIRISCKFYLNLVHFKFLI